MWLNVNAEDITDVNKLKSDTWIIMRLKAFEMKQLWPNQGVILASAWGDWENPWYTSVTTADLSAYIGTVHLPNTSLERYFQTNTFGTAIWWSVKRHFPYTWVVLFLNPCGGYT
jgi:hypothetical protein